MGDKASNPIVMIIVGVVAVVILLFVGFHAMQPPTPPAGSYTPGVPPWLDKNHHSTLPGVHAAGGSGQPAHH